MLSKRLHALASFYDRQEVIWDIGCDHGLLGLSFTSITDVREINLVDPSIKVIEALTQKLEDSYITIPEKIVIHQRMGQEIELRKNPNLIYIAGMGGKEIASIIQTLLPQMRPVDRLVISPHKNIFEMRKLLSQLDLGLIDERLVLEDSRFYQILAFARGDVFPKVSEFGDKIWSDSLASDYRAFMLKTFSAHQDQLSRRFVAFLQTLSY